MLYEQKQRLIDISIHDKIYPIKIYICNKKYLFNSWLLLSKLVSLKNIKYLVKFKAQISKVWNLKLKNSKI